MPDEDGGSGGSDGGTVAVDRRAWLRALGGASVATGLAGCLGSLGGGGAGDGGQDGDGPTDSGGGTAGGGDSTTGGGTTAGGTTSSGGPSISLSGDEWSGHKFDGGNTATAPDNAGPSGPVGEVWSVDKLVLWSLVAEGTVYFAEDGSSKLFAHDAATGERLWSFDGGSDSAGLQQFGAWGTVSDGVLYVGNGSGRLFAIDAASGQKRWEKTVADTIWGSIEVSDGTVYVSSNDLHALDPGSGELLWTADGYDPTNLPIAAVDGNVYFDTRDGLVTLDASGEERWTAGSNAAFESTLGTVPVVADGVVYLSDADTGQLRAVSDDDGSERWRYSSDTGYAFPKLVVVGSDGTVYANMNDQSIHAVDASGEQSWTKSVQVNTVLSSAGDTLYAIGNGIRALDPATGTTRWKAGVGKWASTTSASPPVANGALYLPAGGLRALARP